MTRGICLLLACVLSLLSHGQVVKGKLTDRNGTPLPYASVYTKQSTYGVSTNSKGDFFLEMKPGKHTLVFSYLGYESSEHTITLTAGKVQRLDVQLKEQSTQLREFEIVANTRDLGKEIMRKVRDNRRKYLTSYEGYKCETYLKTSMEKNLARPKKPRAKPDSLAASEATKDTLRTPRQIKRDSIRARKDSLRAARKAMADSIYANGGRPDSLKNPNAKTTTPLLGDSTKKKLNLIESYSTTYFSKPGKYKEIIHAYHDYANRNTGYVTEVNIGVEFGEYEMIPQQYMATNPYLLYEDVSSADFNFYKNLMAFDAITQKPLLSPIAGNGYLSYKYDYETAFYEGDKKIYKIKVTPLYKGEPLFYGFIFIEDSTWALKAVDLHINKGTMFFCSDFRIIQNYERIDTNVYLPVRRELFYTIKEGRHDVIGNTRVNHKNYVINPEYAPRFFRNELVRYEDEAFERSSEYWNNTRPITLDSAELHYVNKSDSISEYYESPEYKRKQDSLFNRINIWTPFNGLGHKNSFKGYTWYISGIFEQVNPVGIGGYRHRLPGWFSYRMKNDMTIEMDGFIDYGFRNKDVKGKMGLGLTYLPKKFVRTFIRAGEWYDMVNPFSSFVQVFSRSNYIRTRSLEIAQRMELVNGLFAELTLDYSDKNPITDLTLSEWSQELFDTLNAPINFQRYTKSEVKLELKYVPFQKYQIRGKRKILKGSDWPTFSFTYRKGIDGLLGSDVDFDYLEIGAKQELQLARFGSSRWNVEAGSFVNRRNLRQVEWNYFRGSDERFFSDPLRSFQLLGPTLSTSTEFFRANYIHHFEGTIMNKVPLFNKMRLGLAGGAGTIIMPRDDFNHFEVFAGVEKIFRIREQLFRFGVYGVTADNNLSKARITTKFGLSFYNSFSKRWDY